METIYIVKKTKIICRNGWKINLFEARSGERQITNDYFFKLLFTRSF